jgi:hypothetical protein
MRSAAVAFWRANLVPGWRKRLAIIIIAVTVNGAA